MGIGKDGYWTEQEILSYSDPEQDVMYFTVLSDRGRGKSYRMKKKLIEWAKNGSKFMCVYRNSSDLLDAMNEWTDPLIEMGYPVTSFAWEGNAQKGTVQLLYEGERIGWFRALTHANSIKHEYFPGELNTVWFDEFIPLVYKKLAGVKSEGDALRTIIKTIDHDSTRSRKERGLRQLRVFMFANPFTWDNPLLSYFKINPLMGYGVHRVGPGIVCEMLPPLDKKNGKMTADDFLGNEVHKNQGWMEQMSYIHDLPKGATPMLTFRMNDRYFWIYDGGDGYNYVVEKSKHHEGIIRKTFDGKEFKFKIGTHEGLREDERCLEDAAWPRILKQWLYGGVMRYENINTKFDWVNAVLAL